MVSENCSLRCRDCSNLMQYYKKPVNIKMDNLHESFDRFLGQVGCIGELRILGGEPFMNPDFYKALQWYAADDKIMKIGIYSNATIFPRENILQYMKHEKVIMHLSDYDELSRALGHWKDFCVENGIAYIVTKMNQWHDCGKLEKRYYTKEQIQKVYCNCECRELPTFLHGRLYNCPYAAHAVNLDAMEDCEAVKDYLSFRSDEDFHSAEEISNFLYKRDYLEACDYCSGRNYQLKAIPAHIQTKEALPYRRKGTDDGNY